MKQEAVRLAIIVLLSQVSWFACVLGAAANNAWVGPAVVLVSIAITLLLVDKPFSVLKLVLVTAALGFVVETLLISTGLISYAAPGAWPGFPPLWLIAMWIAFATLPNTALASLHGRILLQALLGLVGAPLAYFAGARLGAMSFNEPMFAGLAAIGLCWAVAFPALMVAARRIA
jgi:Protein of unknown function (DUF2878)